MANLWYTRGEHTKQWLAAGLLWLCCQAAFGQCAANFSLPFYTNFYSGVKQLPNGGYVVSTAVHRDTVLYIEGSENTRIGLLYLDSCGNELKRLMLNADSPTIDMGSVGCITPDSGLLVIGNTRGSGQCGFSCGLLMRLDKFGNIMWQKSIGSFYENYGFYEALYNPYNGHYYALASIDNRNLNAFLYGLIELDDKGTVLNTATFIAGEDTPSTQHFSSLHILPDSTIGVAGYYSGGTTLTIPVVYCFSNNLELLDKDSFLWDLGYNIGFSINFFQRQIGYPLMLAVEITDTIMGFATSIFEVKPKGTLSLDKRLYTDIIGSREIIPVANNNWMKYNYRGITLYNSNYEPIKDKQMPESNDYIVSSAVQLRSGSYVMSGFKYYYSPQGEVMAKRPHVWQTDQRGWNVGLEQQTKLKSSTVSIYPNPANHTVSIAGGQVAQVSITSITGQQVWKGLLNNNSIEIGHLPNGLYLINVQLLNGNQSTHKLVVQH
ncbi:MAG: T9SS type A sorting domain-containing protein [Bacteroidia bacterium]|jgi:hypothetical protein|nr:T9SS type A sorting domain-containing protein [Bacteroidia bacterium]